MAEGVNLKRAWAWVMGPAEHPRTPLSSPDTPAWLLELHSACSLVLGYCPWQELHSVLHELAS